VFVLDLHGENRYVMTTTNDLAPLLDLPEAQVVLEDGVLRNVGAAAALGIVLGDVIDLLPGESRAVAGDGPWGGWNARG
jgi:hypothetical protein